MMLFFHLTGKKFLLEQVQAMLFYATLMEMKLKNSRDILIQVKAVAFSPDGTKIVTGSGDCTAKLWDLNENLNQVFNGHTGRITSVKFSKDGKEFLTGSVDKTAQTLGY